MDWLDELGLDAELEPHERKLLQTPLGEADPQAVVNATWSSEGMAVLAWALDWSELPAYDESVAPMEIAQQSGFLAEDALDAVVEAELLPAEEIQALQASMLTAHRRLRQYGLRPEHIDFAEFVKTSWWGPLYLEGLRLIDGDLAIGEVPISRASEEDRSRCGSIVLERHRALNWLTGWDEIYSEVDTPT